ncbi:MAG: fructose-bisphosphatase class II, partial [Gaiellales bacterium]
MATRTRTTAKRKPEPPEPDEPCPCTELVSVTERCALAAGRYLGRGDGQDADEAAGKAMVNALARLPISGKVVIGRADDGHPLRPGVEVGSGGPAYELACDPVEGAGVVSRGQAGALSILA